MSWTRLLTTALLLVGLAAGPSFAQTVLRIGLNGDPDALDPTISRAYTGRLVFAAFCDKLFDATPERIANISTLRRRSPSSWPPSL